MNWSTQEYSLKQLATGESLKLKSYTLSQGEGEHIHIQASVHGAELQGNAVILELMQQLPKFNIQGSITFIPLCNPYATIQKIGTYTYGRFNPVTGNNWNRNFIDIIDKCQKDLTDFCLKHKDSPWEEIKKNYKALLQQLYLEYEDQLIQSKSLHDNVLINLLLQKISYKADAILDLHTGPTATRYLYCAQYEESAANYFLFKNVLMIPNEFSGAMDEASFMPWVHLTQTFKKLGRDIECDVHAFTLEFGSEETFCMDWAQEDVKSIINYLKYRGVIQGEAISQKPYKSLLKNYKTIYSPQGGLVDYKKKPGDHFKKGEVLASFYNLKAIDPVSPIESARNDMIADDDGIIINRCPSSAVHQGMELYQVMTNIY